MFNTQEDSNIITDKLSKLWQDLPLASKGIVLNALPLTVLLASLAFIFESEREAAQLETRVETALQVQKNIQEVHTQLLEASTGVRDYLLTGNPDFLGGYEKSKQRLPLLIKSLEDKLDDSNQQALLGDVKGLVVKNLNDLASLSNNHLETANQEMIEKFSAQGQALDALRERLNQMSAYEAKLIEQDGLKVIAERQYNNRITLLAVIAGVLGSLIGVWVFSKTIVARVRTIRDSAAHLAKGEPLALPDISRDELGQLTEELEHASQLLTQSANEAHQARIEAEEASTAKSMFLSRTSHELRTPLNAILGFAQILETDLPEGRQKNSASLINNAGKHLLKLINEVLDIARIETGDLSLTLSPVSLNDILEQAHHYIKPMTSIRDIEIKTSFEPNIWVNADAQKLLQVILNLLSNALKYGPSNAIVWFNAYRHDNHVIIEVIDEGVGIPKELRSRLFTPFDRLGAERTVTEGTGLGLVLSKQLIDAMGGSIHVDENRSRFWLKLSALKQATQSKPESQTSHVLSQPSLNINKALDEGQNKDLKSTVKKLQILYVEDQASNRALMEALMSRYPQFKLHMVSQIKEAMNWMNHMKADLFLIDLNLPDGSGISLIQHIKAQTDLQTIPIIVLSADAMPDTIANVKKLGISAYFTKPLDIAAFNSHLQQTIMS